MAYHFILDSSDPILKQIALVRDEIDDVTDAPLPVAGTDYFVSDERIAARLTTAQAELPADANEVEVRLTACASLLDTLATNQAYVLKVEETLVDKVDGKAVAEAIRAHATALRKRATASLTDRRNLAVQEEVDGRKPAVPRSRGFRNSVVF